MADPMIYLDTAPARRPRKGGILRVANVEPAPARMFAAANIQWLAESCSFPVDMPGLCWGVVPAGDGEKDTIDGIDVGQTGVIFGLYAGVTCYLNTEADYDSRAMRALDAAEDRAIEGKLFAVLAAADATPTAASTWGEAIGVAEEAADAGYVGQPILVMSRQAAVAAYTEGALDGDKEGNLWSPNGTPVLASGSAPAVDTVYITGDLTLFRSDSAVTMAQHPTTNRQLAIAERAYALAIDCDFVIAYQVTETP